MIEEPTPEHQKDLCNFRPVKYHPDKLRINTFVDIHGHYETLGKEALSRVLSSIDVKE